MARLVPDLIPFGAALALFAAGPAMAATQQADPAPTTAPPLQPMLGQVNTFENWAVGCDNRLSCTAVSLLPDDAAEPYAVLIVISRDGGPGGAAYLRLVADDPMRGKLDLLADGQRISQIKVAGDSVELTGEEALGTIRALGSSFSLELRLGRQSLGRPLLAGLPAALRYMDERQGRVGLSDALAALGEGNPAGARVPPPLPAIASPGNRSDDDAAPLTAEEQGAAHRLAICDGRLESSYPPEIHRLDAGHALVLLPCDAGAYNVSLVPLVARGAAGSRSLAIAQFDHMPGFTGEPGTPPLIVNARWNPQLGTLSSFAKGRGLGDCGTAEDYLWDGERFRLIEAHAMPVCRGAWEWPRIWQAGPAAR